MRASARAAHTSVPAKPAGLLARGSGGRCRSPPKCDAIVSPAPGWRHSCRAASAEGKVPRFQLCDLPRQKPRLLRFFSGGCPKTAHRTQEDPPRRRIGPVPAAPCRHPQPRRRFLASLRGARSRATCVFSPPVPWGEALPPALLSHFIDKTTSEFSARHGGICRAGPETVSRRSGSPIRGSPRQGAWTAGADRAFPPCEAG